MSVLSSRLALCAMMSLGSIAGFSVTSAQAQATTEPNRTTATYEDWLVRCESVTVADKPVKTCEMVQGIAAANGQGTMAQVVIGRPAGEKTDHVFVELPPGVWLPDGVSLKISDKELLPLTFKRCVQTCLADTPLTDAQREALFSATTPVTFTFKDPTQKPVAFSISLKGAGDAFKATLQK